MDIPEIGADRLEMAFYEISQGVYEVTTKHDLTEPKLIFLLVKYHKMVEDNIFYPELFEDDDEDGE